MDITTPARSLLRRAALLPALLLWFASAATAQEDPPGRVATLSHTQGSVVFAPDGEDEWTELQRNRPLTRGDRLWTDRGARAELHMGSATVHMDGESHLAFFELNDQAAQLSLTQGSLNLRVRELAAGENFEVDTPNLAIRAAQPGDYRVDVDHASGTTRVLVRSGEATVFGERGESLRLAAGQQGTFDGRGLAQVRGRTQAADEFDQWAGERNQAEDQSVAARHVPRQVVGYQQLDAYGSWAQDAEHGAVWYPHVTVANWAPYRYGRWDYIRPWGWTWIDDAPWGFAPSHYGRWARFGPRWGWVPGRFGPRPVYAPALVAFIGGGSGVHVSINIGSGPGIGWYPLAPGEAWWPTYRTSNVYITNVNTHFHLHRHARHIHRSRAEALTAVRVEDFNRGRPVHNHWRPLRPQDIAHASVASTLPRPDREGGWGRHRGERPARLQAPPPAAALSVAPVRQWPGAAAFGRGRGQDVHERGDDHRRSRDWDRGRGVQAVPPAQQEQPHPNFVRQHEERAREMARQQREAARGQQVDLVREQERAQREQYRLQREAERQQRMQAAQPQFQQPHQQAPAEIRGSHRGRHQDVEEGRGRHGFGRGG